jgi:hypothetical protein|tara:strand:+ start:1319 stop:1528 length:210 start_codon:yes stop_codon:yes gene_type:complete
MDENTKEILQDAYDGYSKSLQGANEFIENTEAQLNQALDHRQMMMDKVEKLKELLGIEEEEAESAEAEE